MAASLITGTVGAVLVWFAARQLRHGADRPWSHRIRGIAYATAGVGVLLGALVVAAGQHGGVVGVLPALLFVIAFYLGGSAVKIARWVESWQAERTRRELGLEPTPWMLPVGLVATLWLIGWMLALLASGMLVYAIMGTGRTDAAYEHVAYPVWIAVSGAIFLFGAGHARCTSTGAENCEISGGWPQIARRLAAAGWQAPPAHDRDC